MRWCAIVAIVLCTVRPPAIAQQIQIPVDDDARLESVTRELEQSIRLFREYDTFQEARLFALPDSSYLLEIEFMKSGAMYRDSRAMTRAEMQAFRASVSDRLRSSGERVVRQQEGRAKLLVGSASLSIGSYGWLLADAFHLTSDRRYTGTVLLTGGIGFFAPYFLTKNARVTDAMATLALQGGARGLLDGLLFCELTGGVDRESQNKIIVATSIAELLVGYEIARSNDMSAGKAAVLSDVGNFGLCIGAAVADAADGRSFDRGNGTGPVAALTGSIVGYAIGNIMANSSHYTDGDADMLSTAGALGAAWPAAVIAATKPKNGKAYGPLCSAGAIAGLVAGHLLQEDRDFTSAQGTWIRLSTAAVGLVGLGFGAMMFSPFDKHEYIFLPSVIGASMGYVFSMIAYTPVARAAHEQSSSWRFTVSPLGVAATLLPQGRGFAQPVPMVSVSAVF